MAVPSFIPVAPSGNGGNNTLYAATLASGGDSGTITTGPDMIILIASTGNLTVRFGTVANLTAATATDMLISANVPFMVDMGHYNSAIALHSLVASNIVTVTQISKN